jgi:pullulanase
VGESADCFAYKQKLFLCFNLLSLIMKFIILILLPVFCFAQNKKDAYPAYAGNDLGVYYTKAKTIFKVWGPGATAIVVRLYKAGDGGEAYSSQNMLPQKNGVWQLQVKKDLKNIYYTFQVQEQSKWLNETPDIYAKAVGVNGKRGMVVDLAETNPAGWAKDKKPALKNFTDIILYETHVRDISISENSGIKNKGKFIGLAETGTKSPEGEKTGLDYLKELGVTHVHLLPSFDFNSVDETNPDASYNWGYDPLNYNVPEGSYSTDPYHGQVRIKEFKTMVQALHANGIRVILDVVYNHTANRESAFNQFVPDYYYRMKEDGTYSDATGCGNETASEKPMMRKFMIASVAYWAREYHLDGFRFDLMGVHDIETMNAISDTLHKIDPSIFIYGEGWTAGSSPLAEDLRAVKKNTHELKRIAAFSDDIRDALHGPFSDVKKTGFASGTIGNAESVKFGIVGATQHTQIDYTKVNYSKMPWAHEPSQSINYVSCHDDNTLYDRLKIGNPNADETSLENMDKLCQFTVFTSQGVPFIHGGAELLRTKQGIANSYKSPDSINEIDWSRKTTYAPIFDYYKGLIALRKAHPAFRMPTTKMIQQHLKFTETNDPLFIAYQLIDNANGDEWKNILVLLNGDTASKKMTLPPGEWILVADKNSINEKRIKKLEGEVEVEGTSGWVLYQ